MEGKNRTIEFENGYSADLVFNSHSNSFTIRLYSPTGLQVASIPSDEEHFKPAAEGLMFGYFAGWRECKRRLSREIEELCNKDLMAG